jgi:hypothetical protein
LRQDRVDIASGNFSQALTIREALLRREPRKQSWIASVAHAHEKVGDAAFQQGRDAIARKAWGEALRQRQVLARQNPANDGWQRSVLQLHLSLGTLDVMEGADDSLRRNINAAATLLGKLQLGRGPAASRADESILGIWKSFCITCASAGESCVPICSK